MSSRSQYHSSSPLLSTSPSQFQSQSPSHPQPQPPSHYTRASQLPSPSSPRPQPPQPIRSLSASTTNSVASSTTNYNYTSPPIQQQSQLANSYATSPASRSSPRIPIPGSAAAAAAAAGGLRSPLMAQSHSAPASDGSSFPKDDTRSRQVGSRQVGLMDELDKWGYQYSLRVAALQQHLMNPPSQPSPSPRHDTFSTPVGSVASPRLDGTSPNGSKLNFSSLTSRPSGGGNDENEPPLPSPSSVTSSHQGLTPSSRRKSSGFLRLGKDKDDSVKLPKEFLMEFWGVLAAEDGDTGWRQATGGFLALVTKKGTKTGSGLNMREIPTLLDTFSTCIPPQGPNCAPVHIHQSHLLQLLYSFLPKSSYFSVTERAQSEKDRDLLFRLRAELQSYMLNPPEPVPPLPGSPTTTPDLRVSPSISSPGGRLASPVGIGMGLPRSAGGEDSSIRRKPSPSFDIAMSEIVETVGYVWGVSRATLERDYLSIKRNGQLEKFYHDDLKRAFLILSALPPPLTHSQRQRQAWLNQALRELVKIFPDLEAEDNNVDTSTPLFYTPPRRYEVLNRLVARATDRNPSAAQQRGRELVERCRILWGVESRRDREAELVGMVQRWSECIGVREEVEWARHLSEIIREVTISNQSNEPLSQPVTDLIKRCLDLLHKSAMTIFPTTEEPPPPPNPSAILILRTLPSSMLVDQPVIKSSLSETSDEIQGAAVGEYVVAVGQLTGGLGGNEVGVYRGENGKDAVIEGFEKVAKWIHLEVSNVQKVWGNGLGSAFQPAALIISKQLPLFLAELQVLDQVKGAASDVFQLYDTTSKLLNLWDDLCPGSDHGFEIDAFFEPHVLAWLKETQSNDVQQWVSRAVGMDSWVPEGENKHSQSVIDLFEFIRASTQIVLHELPLSEYKRAIYLIDLSKTVSVAIGQYAATVQALFMSEINPAKASTPTSEIPPPVFGSKASAWLAKGKQAVKSLEKKKIDGIAIPPTACVKITDMRAARVSIDDLFYAMEAEETARIVSEHKLGSFTGALTASSASKEVIRSVFSVTIIRGEGLLARSQLKPADGFVVVTDKETGERLIKSRTVLGAEDPKWEETFDVSVGVTKSLELVCFDRQLVGKHEPIGSAMIRLDPRKFLDQPIRDIIVPLTPRGLIHLRISLIGGGKDKYDVAFHLESAKRALERAEADMTRELVDKIGEVAKNSMNVSNLNNLAKPLRDKKRPRATLSEEEVENGIMPLFEYLNENFSMFSVTLTQESRISLMLAIWRRLIDILISLLVPPLSDKPSTAAPLSPPEVDIVYKWVQLLKAFFNASEGGIEHGVPMSSLQTGGYRDFIMLGQYLDLPTASLRERTQAAVKAVASAPPGRMNSSSPVGGGRLTPDTAPSSPTFAMRQLSFSGASGGGATARSKVDEDNERMAEVLLRITRTRPELAEFLQSQMATLVRAKVDRQGGII